MKYEKDFLEGIYKDILKTRMMEEKLVDLYAEGIVPGHIHSGLGQEGAYVGVVSTRKAGDYFKFGHRPLSINYIVGEPMDEFFAELLGKITGNALGHGGTNHLGRLRDGVVGFSGTLGCDAGVSVGAAMTIDMEERDNVSYFFYGDGTANRGPIHEAMCLASVWKLPVLFVCENNQFGISTPSSYSSVVKNPGADRAVGYGMPSEVVDGTDVLAVYEAAQRLTKYIREGNGPAVLECKDYRWRGHFEGDQCAYRDTEVTKKYMEEKDCVKNFEKFLKDEGILTDEKIAEIRAEFAKEMEESVQRVQTDAEMTSADIYDCLYV